MWIISAVISLFLLSLAISIIIAINISRTIDNLALASNRLSETGVLIPDLKKTPYTGLNKVIVAFNGMKNSIKENLEKEKLLRQAQLQNLQSQINPHFLFNTLNVISRKALHNKTDDVINLISSISKILRFNLETDSDMISLSEELQILKAYLYIQETRFEDQIRFELDCDSIHSDIMCPPMILQPLVENSIIHGFKNLEEPGIINISMKENPEGIEFRIRDNGCGFHVHQQHGNEKNKSDNRKKSLGIFNVSRRLELHFRRTDLFSIQSSPDTGTEVTMLIPHEKSSST
jgi:sensor histidine kinase YesM